ncbi:class I SAM-dependent DNA methyltransferase [Rhizobium sp. 12,4]|uniref:class I SAM-dependent DNA methyltransferase n=1 Tax=Rhizobium sp. 12,4 TaxID=3405135 RepID=UPI003D340EEC
MNAVEIEEAVSELANLPFDSNEFPFAFLAAFGNKETTIKRLRTASANASDVANGVLQRSNIHIATCSEGMVGETLIALRNSPKTASNKAKFILATDGISFEAEDLVSGETVACAYSKFPDHFGLFLPLAGITTVKQIRESSFDIRATGRLNKLYIELLKDNADWATAARRPDMNHFMARLIFCFFAEDTDIFNGEGVFTSTVDQMSERDSSNTHEVIATLFRAMNTKIEDRATANLARWANGFPYVNGGLFSGSTEVPRFSKIARSYLLHIGGLNWKLINPDIFGSMIQAVTDDEERASLGMHYTSVPNILKVLNPLFLDDLRARLEEAGTNSRMLLNLRRRMSKIRVFDPACGSGNFLVIAYKQMREIEAEINKRRGQSDLRTEIPLTNFRGIELRDFPAEIARLALIIAEYQCDVLYRGQKEALAEFLPLDTENWIVCGNALRLDWLSVCPPTGTGVKLYANDLFHTPLDQPQIDFENEGGETYICGNPPYLGSQWRTTEQQAEMDAVFSGYTDAYRDLDYVAAWFFKATGYGRVVKCTAAFVATKSVSQGRQVAMLWPLIYDADFRITFAHRPFTWKNMAANNAGVTVVIIGITNQKIYDRNIYDDEIKKTARNINAYLLDAQDVIVNQASRSICGLPMMDYGNKPSDGGHLILDNTDKDELFQKHPEAGRFLKKLVGSKEFTSSSNRWCLWISDENLKAALEIPPIYARIEAVRSTRLASKGKQSQDKASVPHRFVYTPHQDSVAMIVPSITSENREYLPVGIVSSDTIISNKAAVVYEPPLWALSIIASRLHIQWIGTVCVRMRTDFSYSNTLGWNTFPVPALTEKNKTDLTRCAEDILLAREAHFPATIAELYNPETMPADLRAAHERNDEVLERIYIGRRFRNDTERLEKLFELYTKMSAGDGTQRRIARQ